MLFGPVYFYSLLTFDNLNQLILLSNFFSFLSYFGQTELNDVFRKAIVWSYLYLLCTYNMGSLEFVEQWICDLSKIWNEYRYPDRKATSLSPFFNTTKRLPVMLFTTFFSLFLKLVLLFCSRITSWSIWQICRWAS